MTESQRKVYEAIRNYVRTKGYPPSVREIGAMVGMSSSSTIHNHLAKIKQQGYIDFQPGKPRTLRIVKDM